MWALAQAYMTSREMGESEAYYKLEPSLHYKQSNIKTIFITSGSAGRPVEISLTLVCS